MGAIKTVVFDIGNVLMTYDWRKYLYSMFTEDVIVSEIQYSLSKCCFWKMMDMGVLSEDEIITVLRESSPNYPDEIEFVYRNLGSSLKKYDYAIPWIQELKNLGIQVLYLSNYSRFTISHNPEVFHFLNYMEGGLFSSEIHLLKPDERIYKALFDKYDISPDESVFIDDDINNIRTACRLKMNTVLFQSYEQAYRDVFEMIKG